MAQTSTQGLATGLGGAFIGRKVAAGAGSSKVFAHGALQG